MEQKNYFPEPVSPRLFLEQKIELREKFLSAQKQLNVKLKQFG